MSKEYTNYNKSRISNKESKVFFEVKMPLAGGFLKKEDINNDKTFPLTLSFCEESCCVQVNESINPELLFKNYFYKTGAIKTLSYHLKSSAKKIKSTYKHNKVLDLGCNDFTFLKNFAGESDLIVGVDPSDVSRENKTDGIFLENDFFSYRKSEELKKKHGSFDVIFSSNNFAHIENIQDYTKGISNMLSEDGVFVLEVHWLGTIIQQMQFSFIYHEHLYYYTLKSLKYLLSKYNLYVNDIDEIGIHGGSIRIFASKTKKESKSVKDFTSKEKTAGLYDFSTYEKFANDINKLRIENKNLLSHCKRNNKTIIGYGASGQANTIMSIFDINKDDLLYIVDDSPLKHGLFTPRNHIQIKSRYNIINDKPSYIYVLAYTFFDEIKNKNDNIESTWIKPILKC